MRLALRRKSAAVAAAACLCLSQVVSGEDDGAHMTCRSNGDDGTIACSFVVRRPADGAGVDDGVFRLRDCPRDDELCVNAFVGFGTVDGTAGRADGSADRNGSDGRRPPDDRRQRVSDGTLNVGSADSGTHGASAADTVDPGTIRVLEATYRKPYSQYGRLVSEVLSDLPRTNHFVEWSNWYLDLGTAHMQTGTPGAHGDGVGWETDWYQMELALNAYRQAIKSMDENAQATTSPRVRQENDLFVASVHYQIGDVYMLHPEWAYLDTAKEHFEKARAMWDALRLEKPLTGQLDTNDVTLRWSDASLRLGSVLMDLAAQKQSEDGIYDAGAMGAAMRSIPAAMSREYIETMKQAEEAMVGAIAGYDSVGKIRYQTKDELVTTKLHLFNAIQTAAIIANSLGLPDVAVTRYRRVVDMYHNDLAKILDPFSVDLDSARINVADTLLSLSDALLQQGKYDESQEAYEQSMTWHKDYNVPIAEVRPIDDDDGGLLESYRMALREYHASISDDGDSASAQESIYRGTYDEYAGGYYGRDDGYEGDLQAAIGTSYLSQGDAQTALQYFRKAAELYKSIGQADDRPTADLELNFALAYFRQRKFDDSSRAHGRALKIYRNLYGDNVNPFVQDIEEVAGMLGVDVVGSSTEGTDSDIDSIRRRVIDIDRFKQSVQNVTEPATEPDAENPPNDEL